MEHLRMELLQKKCAAMQENCAKIVPMFCGASLTKNDHDE